MEISLLCQRWVMLEDLKSCRGVAIEMRLEKHVNGESGNRRLVSLMDIFKLIYMCYMLNSENWLHHRQLVCHLIKVLIWLVCTIALGKHMKEGHNVSL